MSVMSGDEENKKKVDDVGGVDVRDDDDFFSTNNPTLAKKTFGKKNHKKNKIPENVLTKIWDEINFAEYLLLKYLEEIMENYGKTEESDKRSTLRDLSDLIRREIKHLNKVKKSRVVSVSGNFVTFQSDDGEFLVTLVPGEELHKNFQNIFSLSNVKPRFAKPVQSRENCYRTSMTSSTSTSPSTESIYYDALCDIKSDINLLTTSMTKLQRTSSENDESSSSSSTTTMTSQSDIGKSIHCLLKYIFATTIGKLETGNTSTMSLFKR